MAYTPQSNSLMRRRLARPPRPGQLCCSEVESRGLCWAWPTPVKVRNSLTDLSRKYAAYNCITPSNIIIRLETSIVEYSKMPVPNVRYRTCSHRMREKKSRGMLGNRGPRFGNIFTRLNFIHLESYGAGDGFDPPRSMQVRPAASVPESLHVHVARRFFWTGASHGDGPGTV
jgi:hypothetical protein